MTDSQTSKTLDEDMVRTNTSAPAVDAPADTAGRRFSLDVSAHSEIGLVRKNNQDSAYASPTMIIVADGMGGAAAGDLASAATIQELARADTPHEGEQMLEVMAGILTKANDQLADLITADPELDGMGTTVCGAMFSGTQLGLAHIGDSRGYLLHNGTLSRLTHDHSWVQSLLDDGKITAEEAASHPHRSLLLKVLNGQPVHEPDLQLVDVHVGDRLLFCSDGLCGLVDDRHIRRLLRERTPAGAVEALTQAAHEAGGYDNITIIVADVVPQSDELDARPGTMIGAAATVEVPKVEPPAGSGETTTVLGVSGTRTASPDPDGPELIDPDAREDVRYSPMIGKRRRHWSVIISVIVALVVLVGGLFGAWRYAMNQYYIAPSGEQVAIYKGIPDTIAGHSFGELVEQRDTRVSDLPVYYRQRVNDAEIKADTLEQAREQVDYLDELAQACIAKRAESRPDGSDDPQSTAPSPTPSASPSGSVPPSASVDPEDCG
ncbi:PP2C family protein-serine/threonine phosphatase [Propionibacterium australiense]|uniref:PPM-type phosphatase domain n=2 Tax=Propionibacterium australiense TaxID=119981 RepID=A0A383S5C8_9ACTN|nr:protein phosphatase 2C domain-containing protein [Propionibacterium australiense]SYZ33117.1 PPM-type phosphatase domain [Propionibacterium australiense]VEH89133.1 PP2C-family Ser/Thr phosphatase [Propionibacterium australiense]